MSLRIAVQMDPIERIDIAGDSTFALMLEAQRRGHDMLYYTPDTLTMRDGEVSARVHGVEVRNEKGNHFTLSEPRSLGLKELDVVLLRQDPPFDMGYITTTHFLERIHPKTLVVNDPVHVRNAPEKLFVNDFPDLMPATLITRDPAAIRAFREEHEDIILKPLYGNGGAAVFRARRDDPNFNALLEMFEQVFKEPFVVQQYLTDARKGDKRIILVDGEPAGIINRVPAEYETRANLHIGGRPEAIEMSARDREICARIGPELKRRGLVFVGIDVIGDFLTEINVTSPTGIREIQRFGGADIAAMIWDAIEKKRG
ncbi:MAG: glutathione synthase [Hyphomicrobiales bacterium]|nr:glutathione synthase [Hyphomicrobiales bacterium]